MDLTMSIFEQADKLKNILDGFRPLDPYILKNLVEDLIIRWTYHSNAIEGNTLTLLETKVVLEGITVGGKNLREHFEAINHKDAILYVQEIIQNKEPLSEWQIRNIHQLVLKQIDDENAGRYRKNNVIITGARHFPPDILVFEQQMQELMVWYDNSQNLHPIERACHLHAVFVGIHPFVDGNGRTSRLLMNFELMKSGYPPCIIKVEDRLKYYSALDAWLVDQNKQPFLELINQAVIESFGPYQRLLNF